MASSDKDASCANDPDFAVICAFLEKFSDKLLVAYPDFKQLQDWITNTDEVPNGLRDLHIKLMRKTRRTVHECAWETALSKFCFSYSSQDGWEIERFGYKTSSLKVKLRILRELLESQFDRNNKFRAKLLTMSADSLRSQPIGRDRLGHSYWLTQDMECNLRVYQEHLDEEIWQVVATNREELVKLISRLKGNEVVLPSEIGVVDEDSSSNSCSAAIIKPPPPEEKDDSQESNQSTEGRIPNIKIKLGSNDSGIVLSSDAVVSCSEEKSKEKVEEKKVKPLVISQSKITMEKSKKRSLEEPEGAEQEEVKKQRPTLLDSKREKKLSKYEKENDEDDEDDGEDSEEVEEEEESAADGEDEEEGEEENEVERNVEPEEDDGEEENGVERNVEPEEDDGEDEKGAIVGDAVEDPVVVTTGEGSGQECESFCSYAIPSGIKPEFSEVIEETTLFVFGVGSGAECMVGNATASETEPKATFFFGQPGCLKLSPVKTQQKTDGSESCNDDGKEGEKKDPKTANGENHTDDLENNSEKSAPKPSTDVDEEKPKNGNTEEKKSMRSIVVNRKRRLSEEKQEKNVKHLSESETDPHSENLEEKLLEIDEEEDVGGKRLKIRSKLMNTEIRKKVEALRKNATVEETTSSSGEDELPRRRTLPKKNEKSAEKILPLKAKLKQATLNDKALTEKQTKDRVSNDKNKDLPCSPPKSPLNVTEPPCENVTKKQTVNPLKPISKQTKKPHSVENEEGDDEIPKKKQSPAQALTLSPHQNDTNPKNQNQASEPKSPITEQTKPDTAAEDQTPSENQRKRRSSDEYCKEKETSPPKALETPPMVAKTRSSRRSGPPEPVLELPQLKRSRAKTSNATPSDRTELKKEILQSAYKNEKLKVKPSARLTQNKSEINLEVIKQENEDVKEDISTTSMKTIKQVEVKEEPKVDVAIKPVNTTPKSTLSTRPRQQAAEKQPATIQRRKNHDDVDTKNIIDLESDTTPVRQSRRIAQLKIREEAERRKMEEVALRNMKAELKKKKKAEKADDPTVSEPSEHSSDHADSEVEVKKKAEKKKKCPGKGGWSSGSEEPEEEEEEQYETDPGSPLFRSDHEFSPESELEDESQVVPLKRARTARKEGEEVVEQADADESCQKCGKSDHPEWILLCDKCDKGYHCSCLSPVIFFIPEGDWYCPPCQQEELIVALENHLKDFDDLVQRKKEEEEEKLRFEMQERIELEKVRKKRGEAGQKNRTHNKKATSYNDESDENGTDSDASKTSQSNSSKSGSSNSDSESDSDDEPIYKLRKRRQINVSYRLNEYDDMIKSALKEEEDEVAGAGNLGRGKDISTIIEADKEEKFRQQQQRISEENGEVIAKTDQPPANAAGEEDSGSEFEPLKRKPKGGRHLKKKARKLTTLDISSEGDNDSDEDFKTSSMDDEEEEDDDEEDGTQSSDSSLDAYRRGRRGGRKNKKKTRRAARRAARERRKDRNFIVEDSDASQEQERHRTKKKRKKDSDYTESETNDDDEELSENIDSNDLCDDSTESEASDGAWRPLKRKKQRSNIIARKSPKLKPKAAPKAKKSKPVDSYVKSGKSNDHSIGEDSDYDDDDDIDSVDSSRKTRGKRCLYLEDYEDDSSDGGIKPGVKRPDTPPEEREKFIKKQEEIKRMLAEKNAEGAKLAATPRLIPIKAGPQRSPAKLDPLSTVPLSVIRQAKVLDIDYLQRKGESISEEDLDESEFDDDDLPDDFNPEDMDEEAIARMVEEEDFAQQQLKLPLPADVLRKKNSKEMESVLKITPPILVAQPPQSTSLTSGLQEPVRKKLPRPTLHPPLLRHNYGPPLQHMPQHNRAPAPQHLTLLQNALSAPLNHPMSRSFAPTTQAIPATTQGMSAHPQGGGISAGGDPNKPRGRRKKITPLRDPLQKQQAAAAASAAAAAASKPRTSNQSPLQPGKAHVKPPSATLSGPAVTPGVIKSALSIAQPPQLYKPPLANTQPSVITRMPHLPGRPLVPVSGPPFPEQGNRFYRPQPPPSQQQQQQSPSSQTQPPPNAILSGNRPPMRHRGPPMPPMNSHHSLRPSYVSGPPPLRPVGPPISLPNDIREHGPPRQSSAYSGAEQQYASRHPTPSHLNPYRPQMFGSPGFPPRGPPPNSSQPNIMRPSGAPPEYTSPGSYVAGYGYYPPPLSVPHSAPPNQTTSAVPSSVIVSASSLAAVSSASTLPAVASLQPPTTVAAVTSRLPAASPSLIEKTEAPMAAPVSTSTTQSVIELSRKKLTTLETFNTSKTATPPPPLQESSESASPYSSNPPTSGGNDDASQDAGNGSPIASTQSSTSEFSGLVSYFSSQHDDLNT